ncbi:MAG TPA: folylpolyglutamate synthase/dihydrofolate synthase family protein, partial [Urbifossiella sp.]
MTYDEAIAFWYGRINYEVRAAGPGDLKLERMEALLQRLGNPHHRLRIVHITGTKGKGSTAAMLAAILGQAGYRVGLFTSPHLSHVEERIQVDGRPISREDLTARMEEVAAAASGSPPPTFFEIGTALGFLHFQRTQCDIAIVEVGLGGRFDSTNVCIPLVSIITNVGFDHMAQLGNTLEAIAFEKAGIIKRGVPIVSGISQQGPLEVVRTIAREQDAPFWEAKQPLPDPNLPIGLLGEHQRENAACAIAAVHRLRDAGLAISNVAIRAGLAAVKWPARIELVSRNPAVILDTAHNVPSAEALVRTLAESFPVAGRKSVVFAVSSDKQYPEILRILAGYFDHFHLTKYGNNPRSVPPEKLAEVLVGIGSVKNFTVHSSSVAAWQAALAAAS